MAGPLHRAWRFRLGTEYPLLHRAGLPPWMALTKQEVHKQRVQEHVSTIRISRCRTFRISISSMHLRGSLSAVKVFLPNFVHANPISVHLRHESGSPA